MLRSSSSFSRQAGLALTASARQPVGVGDLGLQPGQVPLQPGPHRRVGAGAQAVGLHDLHLQQLLAAGQQGVQGPHLGRGQRPGLGADGLGEVGQDLGVDAVGLGQPAGGLGEVAGLAGVDRGGRDAGDLQGGQQGQLQAAGGLDDDQGRGQGLEPGDQGGDAGRVVGVAGHLAAGPGGGVEVGLGDIDADEDRVWYPWVSALVRVIPACPVLVMRPGGQVTVRAAVGRGWGWRPALFYGLGGPKGRRPTTPIPMLWPLGKRL